MVLRTLSNRFKQVFTTCIPTEKGIQHWRLFFPISTTIVLQSYLIKWALKANVLPQGRSKLQWEGVTATSVGISGPASTPGVSVATKLHLSRFLCRLNHCTHWHSSFISVVLLKLSKNSYGSIRASTGLVEYLRRSDMQCLPLPISWWIST